MTTQQRGFPQGNNLVAKYRYIVRFTPHNQLSFENVYFDAESAFSDFEECKRQAHKAFCEDGGETPMAEVDMYREQNR